jgi:hypothetical protein
MATTERKQSILLMLPARPDFDFVPKKDNGNTAHRYNTHLLYLST